MVTTDRLTTTLRAIGTADRSSTYSRDVALRAEFTIEPFREGNPGPHVSAALDVANRAQVDVDIGPFGTAIEGDDGVVLGVLAEVLKTALAHGASRVSVQVTVKDG